MFKQLINTKMIKVVIFLVKVLALVILFFSNFLHILVSLILWDYKFLIDVDTTIESVFPPKKANIKKESNTIVFDKIWSSLIGKK